MCVKIVEIGLHVQCDFRCTYCISEKHDKWANLMVLDKDKLISFIDKFIDNDVLIALTGGEPLLWDGLYELIESFPNNLFMISSNIKHLPKHDWLVNPTSELKDRLCFRIGWHPNVRTDDFIEKINIIKDAGYHYVVNYMIDNIDRYGDVKSRIKYLEDNAINYEISSEESGCLGVTYRNDMSSTQFHMRNFLDNKYFMRINANGNVYPCYVGDSIGNINDGSLNLSKKSYNKYCSNCIGLKGYLKILSQWNKFDFGILYPKRDRFRSDKEYEVFKELVKYIPTIDNKDSLSKYRSYRVKF